MALLLAGLLVLPAGAGAGPDRAETAETRPEETAPAEANVDAAIRESVVRVLTDAPKLDIVGLDVAVDRGIISLTGRVATPAEKHLAARHADDVVGSQGVVNGLEVVPGLRQLNSRD
jgi:osmotically-inducible protein OsmY